MAKGSIQRRDNRWRVVVPAPPDPVTGKRRQVARHLPGDRPRREAEELLHRLMVEVGGGAHVGHDATLSTAIEAWLKTAKLEASTRRDYQYAIKLIPAALGDTALHKVRAADLDQLYAHLGRNRGPDRVRRVHHIIRRTMAQAVRWGWIARNVAVDASPPSAPAPRPVAPDVEVVRRLLAAADDELLTWLILDADLGARRGEISALRWGDVDLARRQVIIQRALADGGPGIGVYAKSTKSERVRTVAITARTAEVLTAHRRVAIERALAVGVQLPSTAWLWATDAEGITPVRPDAWTKRFAELRAEAGVTGVTLKQFRHFVATQLIAAGVDPRTVAGRLGHARTSTTLDIYAAWVPAQDAEAADLLGRIVSGGV